MVALVVINFAVQGLTAIVSGCGPGGVGIMAGDCTVKIAWNVAPFSSSGSPF